MYLDRWWTTLQGGVPDIEIEMEPHSCQRGEKKKKEPTKRIELEKRKGSLA